jgi:hypothetical protein
VGDDIWRLVGVGLGAELLINIAYSRIAIARSSN